MFSPYRQFFILLLLFTVLLTGCAAPTPTVQPTIVPTIAIATAAPSPTPPAIETPGYPAAVIEETVGVYPYPDPYPIEAEDGPPRVTARENLSRVTAKLIEQAPDSSSPDWVRLRVLVTAVSEVPGMANSAQGLLSQECDLFVQKDNLVALQPGDVFDAEVSFRGDENGAKYTIVRFIR